MRFLTRLIVLGFAGLGMYRAWELVEPRISEARQRAVGARDRMEPAVREAAGTLQTATKDAAETLVEGSDGLDEMPAPDPFGAAAERIPTTRKPTT